MTDLPLDSAGTAATPTYSGWFRFVATIEDADPMTVVIFSVIGFLATLSLILRFPILNVIS
jgi:hypothetical protein